MNSIIYWFSGTGNSLYAAKGLSEMLGDTQLVSISSGVSPEPVGGTGCKIGFVFPSYYGDLPRVVRSFAEKLTILPDTDIFTVVTMGAFGLGSVKAMAETLSAKGLNLRYGVGLRMPANYIISYDPALFGAKSDKRIQRRLNKKDKILKKISVEITSGISVIKQNSIMAKTLYTDIAELDKAFIVSDTCTSCGLCEKVCPVRNIKFENGKPVWLHHCEHCVACISWCPLSAIEYGDKTLKRTRYRNPRIKVSELMKAKG
jgi:ferredoxin